MSTEPPNQTAAQIATPASPTTAAPKGGPPVRVRAFGNGITSLSKAAVVREYPVEDLVVLVQNELDDLASYTAELRFDDGNEIDWCGAVDEQCEVEADAEIVGPGDQYGSVVVSFLPKADWKSGPWTISFVNGNSEIACRPGIGFCVS